MTEAGRSSTAARAAAVIMIATLSSKILGFFRELLIGSKFGATSATDAYLVSLTVPAVLFATVAGALSTTFIPVYSEIETKKGRERAVAFAGNLFNVILIVSLIFSLFGAIFSRLLVKLVAMGFSGETLEMAAAFTRITMFMSAFVALANVLTGYLQSNREFTVPAIVGIPYNVIIITALLSSATLGIWGLVVATVLAAAVQALIQLPAATKAGLKFTLNINFADEDLKRMGILIIPVVLGTGVSQVNVLVDRMLASTLEEGTIAALNFASRLNSFVYGLFTLSVATVVYPSLSRLSAEGDMEGFKRALGRALGFVIAIVMPLSAGAMVLRIPIVRFLFERGAFDSRATFMTATALLYYSVGMVGFGLRDVLSRAFYSIRDTSTPMVNGAAAMGINIVLNLILVRIMGLGGLALSTSISALAGTVLLFSSLRKKIGPLGGFRILTGLIKSAAACAVMGFAVHYIYGLMSKVFVPRTLAYQALDLGVSVLAGVVVYLAIVLILKMDDVIWAVRAFIPARLKK
ncbi:murein biosynthesis integral membrane protein MurJ [Thermosediminibacter litoriperuensis]|uniref:Probable lipid II flippase MurJ n=1 Tax=Thermosediminibacter litoriperuensis TaxID=291989 RepID=A0A5S5AHW9_9FIRM|nr:murein biosynthesis integral membrane protein MurJ [Thermosediminibacter litoriperuensis]TYP49785.1 putative peptidoglycan lipid II flippase [Thermosediminibacter litoriperuensis]